MEKTVHYPVPKIVLTHFVIHSVAIVLLVGNVCLQGQYGENCSLSCSKNCADASCDPFSGHCSSCRDGWKGAFCNTTCSKGKFGCNCMRNCSKTCTNATCEASVPLGFTGLIVHNHVQKVVRGVNVIMSVANVTAVKMDGLETIVIENVQEENMDINVLNTVRTHVLIQLVMLQMEFVTVVNQDIRETTVKTDFIPTQKLEMNISYHMIITHRLRQRDPIGNSTINGQSKSKRNCNSYRNHNDTSNDTECSPGSYGDNCDFKCSENCALSLCNEQNGYCYSCVPGSKGDFCNKTCDNGWFGYNCSLRCPDNCRNKQCDPINGLCKNCKEGYFGDRCDKVCSRGYYGENCSMQCSKNCDHNSCDPASGQCIRCKDGYLGHFCDKECQQGLFGYNCKKNCSSKCFNSICNPVSGACVSCVIGFKGHFCEEACDKCRFGYKCSLSCPANCRNNECDPINGLCHGCSIGYMGDTCDKDFVPVDCMDKIVLDTAQRNVINKYVIPSVVTVSSAMLDFLDHFVLK
ncbi:multiple epidermal growth factor-like domains protein 11, partial [Physella acuta]|uniref:multiple epidermal growth factor-like domains protein 11 n=1 Tax=Physella acuta TaxID=109671 RepID=UPI0027DE68B4